MRSTPIGMGRGYTCLFIVFSETLSGLDSWEKFGTPLYIHLSVFGKGKTRVLQHLLGFLWLLSFDDVSSHVIVSFINVMCMPFPFSLLLN